MVEDMHSSRKPTSFYLLACEPSVVAVEDSRKRESGEDEKKEAEENQNKN